MPVILPSYGERASEVLIAQLTKNYKATVMLSDVSRFRSKFLFFNCLIFRGFRTVIELLKYILLVIDCLFLYLTFVPKWICFPRAFIIKHRIAQPM